jgi:hypothetical protein
MNAVLTIVFAMLIVLVLVAAWSTFIGGTCTKDSQCPAGYVCSGGSAGGKCVAKGSFTVDPKIHATGARGPRHPLHSAMVPDACSGGAAPLRERLIPNPTNPPDRSGKRSGRVSGKSHHHPLMIGAAPPPGGFMR